MPSSRVSSRPRVRTHVSMSPAWASRFFTTRAAWEAISHAKDVDLVASRPRFATPCKAAGRTSSTAFLHPGLFPGVEEEALLGKL